MVGLLSLSNELLMIIYRSSPTLHEAANLAAANKELHAGWTKHNDAIVAGKLRSQIPDFEHAVDLATRETQLLDTADSSTGNLDPDSEARPPLRACVSRLLRNAELAASGRTATASYPYLVETQTSYTYSDMA